MQLQNGKKVEIVTRADSHTTREIPRKIFATQRLSRRIVSDNGTVLKSQEMKELSKRNNISHITSALYHPVSNGLAEHYVQTFKQSLEGSIFRDIANKIKPIFVPI